MKNTEIQFLIPLLPLTSVIHSTDNSILHVLTSSTVVVTNPMQFTTQTIVSYLHYRAIIVKVLVSTELRYFRHFVFNGK
jgi:hypothetical protein